MLSGDNSRVKRVNCERKCYTLKLNLGEKWAGRLREAEKGSAGMGISMMAGNDRSF